MQWRNEIEAHTDGMKVLVWHGASRESSTKELKKYDVVCQPNSSIFGIRLKFCQVLTTYAVLERFSFPPSSAVPHSWSPLVVSVSKKQASSAKVL